MQIVMSAQQSQSRSPPHAGEVLGLILCRAIQRRNIASCTHECETAFQQLVQNLRIQDHAAYATKLIVLPRSRQHVVEYLMYSTCIRWKVQPQVRGWQAAEERLR
jgi:hypothetical protein